MAGFAVYFMVKGVFFISTCVSSLVFSPITLDDRSWMMNALKKGPRTALEYSFTSNFIWREIYQLSAARFEDRVVVMSNPDNPSFIFPSGEGPVEPVVRAIYDYVTERGQKLVFNTLINEDREKLEAAFPGKFNIIPDRNDYDYIYDAQRLISLSGKKLSSKRNHINRFKATVRDWHYEAITHENIEDARKMSLEWCILAGCRDDESLYDESCAVEQSFKHFFDLNLKGGILYAEGRPIAFSIGEALNEDTFVVHVEKAFHDIQGAYQLINQEFARAEAQGFTWINREDDAGDEGLRKAKLSYYPDFFVEKSSAELIDRL